MIVNVLDIETYGSDNVTPYLVGVSCYNKKFFTFGKNCVGEALRQIFMRSRNNDIYYCHNLTFDGLLIIDNLERDFEIDSRSTFIIRGNIYSLGIRFKRVLIIFRCTFRLMPMALSDIALILDHKLKGVFDHGKVNEENYIRFKDEVVGYCRRDLEITESLVKRLNEEFKIILPEWRLLTSISSIALKIMSLKSEKIVLELAKGIDNAIRMGFYGGRCEVFGNVEDGESVYHFDFSGMYSNRLLDALPVGLPKRIVSPLSIKIGFYSVKVRSEGFEIPILPFRDINSGKLLFPNGIFEGVYWHTELELFLSMGGIIENIYWGYEFEAKSPILGDFASMCIENRKKNKFCKTLWKLIPNSLIGRLGLRPLEEETKVMSNELFNPLDDNIINDKCVNSNHIVRYRKISSNSNVRGNVIIPAVITSEARKIWWKASSEVIKSGGRLLYCDTDSIYAAFKRDVLGEKHGDVYWDPLNPETVVEDSVFALSKAYAVKFKKTQVTKIKGVKKNSMSMAEFKKCFNDRSIVELGVSTFEKKNFKITIDLNKIKKINLSKYDKRIFNEERTRTKALYIESTLDNES